MIKTREPSPEMAAASKPSGFKVKRRAWRDDEDTVLTNKQITNGEQKVNKQITNGEQKVNKQITNGEQSDIENTERITNGEQKVNKRVSEPITSRITNGEQKVNKRITKPSFFQLVGLQKKVTLYIYGSCQLNRSAISGPITLEEMSETLESPKGSIKTTTNRLRQKHIITTIDQKEGRGGFTKYRLDDSIYQEILHNETVNKRLTNGEQKVNKRVSEPITEPITSLSSSSSILINKDLKTTTTSANKNAQLSEEWKTINFSSLFEQGVSFSESHLIQLMQRTKHTPKMVQDAIEHFAFDLKHNDKRASIKGDPLGFFMGIMQRGMYVAPSNFIDPREAELDHYLAQQEAKLARMQEKLANKENLDFEIWLLQTTEEQRREIAPQAKQDMSEMQKGILRNYWKSSLSESKQPLKHDTKEIQKQIEASLSGNT